MAQPSEAQPSEAQPSEAQPSHATQRLVVAHFIVSADVERSRRFYTEVLGGRLVFGPQPTYVALANGFIVINVGGGPTDDKPTVTLETQSDSDRVSSFLNLRVADIEAAYTEWSARGRNSSPRPSTISLRSVATSGIPTATSSRLARPPTHRETGGPPTGLRSTQAEAPTEPSPPREHSRPQGSDRPGTGLRRVRPVRHNEPVRAECTEIEESP